MSAAPDRLSAEDIDWERARDVDPDHRNLDLAEIAIVALEEAQSYRILAQQAIHLLHLLDIQLKQLRNRYYEVLEQLRHNRTRGTKGKRRPRR